MARNKLFEAKLSRRELLSAGVLTGSAVATTALLPGVLQAAESLPAGAAPPKPLTPLAPRDVLDIKLMINGEQHALKTEARVTLLDALRENLGLTGSKKGCDHGQCGACTVLVNGTRVLSCLTLAVTQQGADITTIEGLAWNNALHPMQAAFVKHDGFQCGYCTPGQIMSAVGLLNEARPATDAAIREGMAGNICRCGAYAGIVAAVREVRDELPQKEGQL